MTIQRPCPTLQQLETDLREEVAIEYEEGGLLKKVSPFVGIFGYGGARFISTPEGLLLEISDEEPNDPEDPGDGCHQKVIAKIPLARILAIEVWGYGDGKVPYLDRPEVVACWRRDASGELRRFPLQ